MKLLKNHKDGISQKGFELAAWRLYYLAGLALVGLDLAGLELAGLDLAGLDLADLDLADLDSSVLDMAGLGFEIYHMNSIYHGPLKLSDFFA